MRYGICLMIELYLVLCLLIQISHRVLYIYIKCYGTPLFHRRSLDVFYRNWNKTRELHEMLLMLNG